MYIRKATRNYKGKLYTNHLLVESIHTSKGPRQKVICSLGDLSPRPREAWLELAHKMEGMEHDLEGYRFCRLRWPTFIRLASTPPELHRRICPRQNTACIVPAGSVMPPGRSLCTSDRRF